MATQVTCPGCQRPLRIADGVTRPWVTCPHCLARVANPQAREADEADQLDVDYEVGRDVHKMSCLLIVLACFGVLTLLGFVPMTIEGIRHGDAKGLLGLGLCLGVPAALSAAYVLWRRPGQTPAASAGRVIVGTLAVIGAIAAGTVAVGFAIVVYLFAVCLTQVVKS